MNEITGPGAGRESSPPSPYVDRAALSEAWYRALYGRKPQCAQQPQAQARTAATSSAASTSTPCDERGTADRATGRTRTPLPSGERRTLPLATVARLRVRRDVALARIVRQRLAETARRTTCRLELPEGSVDVLLQQRGRRIHLVAVSERAAGVRLSAALERARAALLAQGVRLHIDSRAKGPT